MVVQHWTEELKRIVPTLGERASVPGSETAQKSWVVAKWRATRAARLQSFGHEIGVSQHRTWSGVGVRGLSLPSVWQILVTTP